MKNFDLTAEATKTIIKQRLTRGKPTKKAKLKRVRYF